MMPFIASGGPLLAPPVLKCAKNASFLFRKVRPRRAISGMGQADRRLMRRFVRLRLFSPHELIDSQHAHAPETGRVIGTSA